MPTPSLRLTQHGSSWALQGEDARRFGLVNDYLDYLANRAYSPRTVEAYAFDLLTFVRWLVTERLELGAVTTDVLLRYLAACRAAPVRGRPSGNVYSIRDGRNAGYAPTTINRRLAAISGLFAYREMLDPDAKNPVPRGREARRMAKGERSGMLGHLARRPRQRSPLRVREPRRLPRGLDRDETRALLASLRTDRDRAIAGLMLFSGLRSFEVLGLEVRDVDIGRGWVRVIGKGNKERRVPLDSDVAGLIQAYLLAERPETTATALFVVAKGPNRGRPLSRAGLRTVFRYHRESSGVSAGHPHALRHSFGTALAEAGVDLPVIRRSWDTTTSTRPPPTSTSPPPMSAPPMTPPEPDSAPKRPEPGRPEPAELLDVFAAHLAATGRRVSTDSLRPARKFLRRWPDPQVFATEPLQARMEASKPDVQAFVAFLMARGHLRPGYDYLLARRFTYLWRELKGTSVASDVKRFVNAAAELGFARSSRTGTASQVVARVLLQTGKCLDQLGEDDMRDIEAAIRQAESRTGRRLRHYSGSVFCARAVLYHLGSLPEAPSLLGAARQSWADRMAGVPDAIRASFVAYLERLTGTHAPETVSGRATRLASFGRFLAEVDPDLTSLAELDRRRHIEPWLSALTEARSSRSGAPVAVSERHNRIVAVRCLLDDIAEWGWDEAPSRRLIFARDAPRLPRPLPGYLTPDADRRLVAVLEAWPRRLIADALLLQRACGLRSGELVDLELDWVHEIPGQGAWLKVPLGKFDTERMVPIDDETVAIIDRIVVHRSPGRPLRHPRNGRLVEFLLTLQGHRMSKQLLCSELARAAADAGLNHTHPHQLRHTFATALVNQGVSLQSLMILLGHQSADMSMRYGRLFDSTVRTEYEKALTLAKKHLGPVLPAATPVELNTDWRDAPLIKARLAGGYCLRTAAQGACAYSNICEFCPNFRTDTTFLAVLGAQRADAAALAADAEARGWGEEATRHRHLVERIEQLMNRTQAG